jgi:hypothetical protein
MQIPPGLLDLVTAGVGFLMTIFILSYLFGDNALFRMAIYVFIGAAAGYVTAVALTQVLYPALIQPLFSPATLTNPLQLARIGIPLVAGLLLLFKLSPRLSHLGQLPMAYLAGVGAAVAIGGAVLGTILPQVSATFNGLDLISAGVTGVDTAFMFLNGAVVLLGVVGTLAYFQFGAAQKPDGSVRRNPIVTLLSWVGRVFIAITFGVLFAGVYMAALTALLERMDAVRNFFILLIQQL